MHVRVMVCAMAMAALMATGSRAHMVEAAAQGSKAAAAAPAIAINLNVATIADLEKLPGVGAAMAGRILEYRQKSGGFKRIEELMNVKGIGEKNFLKLKNLVTIAPAKTADR